MNTSNTNLSIEDLNFCLQFELDAMHDFFLKDIAERWLHGFNDDHIEKLHLARYQLALNYIKSGDTVLDIAGGTGYGSYYLAENCPEINMDSIDIDSDSIRYASLRYPHLKIHRKNANAETYKVEENYDVIISFETIEHLKNYRNFLQNCQASLKKNGQLIISTPIVAKTSTVSDNPFHVIEWSFGDFQKLISEYFNIEEIYLQNIKLRYDYILLRMNHWMKRLKNQKIEPRSYMEKYNNQYKKSAIIGGYQVLVCKKK